MPRLPQIDAHSPDDPAAALLDQVSHQLGKIPNLYRTMANSPAALSGYLGFRAALVKGKLPSKLREQLALFVAAENDCGYCLAAHTFRGAKLGITADELQRNRRGDAADARTAAALRFARTVLRRRGNASDAELAAARAAGWTDEELAEIVGHVALNLYSNLFNHLARPDLDFPAPPAPPARQVTYGAPAPRPSRIQRALDVPFDDALARLRTAIEAAGLWVIQELDPEALLAREGFQIGRARQLLFFHPRFMARLLEQNPAAVVDAPLKLVVLERPDGGVWVVHDDVRATLGANPGLTALADELAALCTQILGAVTA